jgi:hypothetical protein
MLSLCCIQIDEGYRAGIGGYRAEATEDLLEASMKEDRHYE